VQTYVVATHELVRYQPGTEGIDWEVLKGRLDADNFDNGRTPEELRRSFDASHSVVIAWLGAEVVGTARMLADGVCNAYLVDVWTDSRYRRRGIGTEMVVRLMEKVPGHHIGLFSADHPEFYTSLGFQEERVGMSKVAGLWLNRYPPRVPGQVSPDRQNLPPAHHHPI
jgi:predicted GNAT family acetyltransferase